MKCQRKRRSFLERKNWYLFIDPQKTKVDQNCYIDILKASLLPECRRLYPGIDFVFMQVSAPSYHAKATQQFLRQKTPDFIAANEHHNRHHILQILFFRLLHLGYPAGFGVRRPTTSVCKSIGPQWGNEKQVEGHHWDSSKIHCAMEEKKLLHAVRNQNRGTIQHISR